MNPYWIRPTAVLRTIFLDGRAKCRKCQAHVQPSVAISAFVRIATASAATAWCGVCCTTTDYDLEPHRAA